MAVRSRARLCAAVSASLALAGSVSPARSQSPANPSAVAIVAAGSLIAPLNAVKAAISRESGIVVSLTFGPSGTLRERLEKGERADLFASANMEHPQALAAAGLSGPVRLFTRNALCGFTRPDVGATPGTLLDRMLDPKVAVATSTPVADPASDYAWQLFRRADRIRPGAFATLDAKALQLFGGARITPPPPPVPSGRNPTAFHLETRTADIYLQYCSGRAAFTRDAPQFLVVDLPAELSVGADYGITMLNHANPAAASVLAFILSPAGQRLFVEAGFQPVTTPPPAASPR